MGYFNSLWIQAFCGAKSQYLHVATIMMYLAFLHELFDVSASRVVLPSNDHCSNIVQTCRYVKIECKIHVNPAYAKMQIHDYGC